MSAIFSQDLNGGSDLHALQSLHDSESFIPDIHTLQLAGDLGVVGQGPGKSVAVLGKSDVHTVGVGSSNGIGSANAFVTDICFHFFQQVSGEALAATIRPGRKISHLDILAGKVDLCRRESDQLPLPEDAVIDDVLVHGPFQVVGIIDRERIRLENQLIESSHYLCVMLLHDAPREVRIKLGDQSHFSELAVGGGDHFFDDFRSTFLAPFREHEFTEEITVFRAVKQIRNLCLFNKALLQKSLPTESRGLGENLGVTVVNRQVDGIVNHCRAVLRAYLHYIRPIVAFAVLYYRRTENFDLIAHLPLRSILALFSGVREIV